jgi:hypothetical protein
MTLGGLVKTALGGWVKTGFTVFPVVLLESDSPIKVNT